ncbi:nuclear transport factor 2 family protein [Pseudogemmobacter sonorensis]|uniref:nuclear transport factor 2 family protein n=1 Tax=Pseudogemmobacter sonorensis TaxID=2989681 RepID=UPI0036B962C4
MDETRAIARLIERYFAALHSGDTAEIAAIFLPECDLIWARGKGEYSHTALPDYLGIVAGRPAPASAGFPRFGEILSIDLNGPDLARVLVDSAVQPRFYRDYLTLVRVADGWRIASKIYRLLRDESAG